MGFNVFKATREGDIGIVAIFDSKRARTHYAAQLAGTKTDYSQEMTSEMIREEISALREAMQDAFSFEKPRMQNQINEYAKGLDQITIQEAKRKTGSSRQAALTATA
jgi:hypothetical protein